MNSTLSRRHFLKSGVAAGIAFQFGAHLPAVELRSGIPYHQLGRTKEAVSAIGIGGFHIGEKPTEDEAAQINDLIAALSA